MSDPDQLSSGEVSEKLNVIIGILLHFATKDTSFNGGKQKTGDLASYLNEYGLSYNDIAAIVDSPVASVRELVRRKRKSKNKKGR